MDPQKRSQEIYLRSRAVRYCVALGIPRQVKAIDLGALEERRPSEEQEE